MFLHCGLASFFVASPHFPLSCLRAHAAACNGVGFFCLSGASALKCDSKNKKAWENSGQVEIKVTKRRRRLTEDGSLVELEENEDDEGAGEAESEAASAASFKAEAQEPPESQAAAASKPIAFGAEEAALKALLLRIEALEQKERERKTKKAESTPQAADAEEDAAANAEDAARRRSELLEAFNVAEPIPGTQGTVELENKGATGLVRLRDSGCSDPHARRRDLYRIW